MDWGGPILTSLDVVMCEAALFAAAGFVILGAGDAVMDVLWVGLALAKLRRPLPTVAALPPPRQSGKLAVFIPAWDESAVIGDMLRSALAAWGDGDYRLYVGCYPNDPATIEAVSAVADPRVRLVVGSEPGPTTKADCLNRLWEAMLADEAKEGMQAKAVILHDAEDLVPPEELRVFNRDLPLPAGFRIDAYGQAGVVGARSRDLFAEASARVARPIGGGMSLGAGLWGAAQPGAERLDVGPSLSLRLPRLGASLSADWRFRAAGRAQPGSGPALTLWTDF